MYSNSNSLSSNEENISNESNGQIKDNFQIAEEKNNNKNCFFKKENENEQIRLGYYSPLGPIFSQIVTALFYIVDSFWISKSIGSDGLTATGVVSLLEAINNSFGLYLSTCVSVQISYLFGQKRNDECPQIFVDIIRISFIIKTPTKPFTIFHHVEKKSCISKYKFFEG